MKIEVIDRDINTLCYLKLPKFVKDEKFNEGYLIIKDSVYDVWEKVEKEVKRQSELDGEYKLSNVEKKEDDYLEKLKLNLTNNEKLTKLTKEYFEYKNSLNIIHYDTSNDDLNKINYKLFKITSLVKDDNYNIENVKEVNKHLLKYEDLMKLTESIVSYELSKEYKGKAIYSNAYTSHNREDDSKWLIVKIAYHG